MKTERLPLAFRQVGWRGSHATRPWNGLKERGRSWRRLRSEGPTVTQGRGIFRPVRRRPRSRRCASIPLARFPPRSYFCLTAEERHTCQARRGVGQSRSPSAPLVCWLLLKTALRRPEQRCDVEMSGQLAGAPGGESHFPASAFSPSPDGVRGVNASRETAHHG